MNRRLTLGLAILLALAYLFFNLHSAWDPATRLTNIRAGLVNEDEAVTVGGTKVAVGEDLSRTLLDEKTFGWRTLTRTEAEEQLGSGALDFYLYIPKDASQRVVGLPTAAKPAEAILTVYADPAYNYPMNDVADKVAAAVREQLNGKIAATYLDALLGGLSDLPKAAVGARQIADGAKVADDGADQLAAGLDQAKYGADQLYSGIGQVATGAVSLSDGAVQIRDGNRQLATGLGQADAGSRQIADGTKQIVDGYAQLADGNAQLGAGIGRATDGVRQIKQGVQDSLASPDPELAAASAAVERAMKNLLLRRPYLYMDRDYKALMAALQKLSARGDQLQKESVATLVDALTQLEQGLEQAEAGSRQLTAGARQGYSQGQALVTGTRDLSRGISEAAAGARRLADGADRLAAGAQQLASGSGRLQAGGQTLAAGLGQLKDGGHRLSGGLTELAGGTEQLATGLGGAGSGPSIPARQNAPAMSQPVKVVSDKVTTLPKPGEALLGLVIPIALWIGALALLLACRLAGIGPGEGATPAGRLRSLALPGGALALGVAAVSLAMGPRVAHPILFILFIGLAAFSFLAINQALVGLLGNWGYLVSGLLLVLMPVAVGGRAPYILLPAVYRWVAPFMPLAHAIRGVQATISGGAWGIFWISVALLLAFLGLSLWALGRWGGARPYGDVESVT